MPNLTFTFLYFEYCRERNHRDSDYVLGLE